MKQQCVVQSMAGAAAAAADGNKGLGPLLAGWDGDLADAAPESQAQRAAPVTAGGDVLNILSACGQCVRLPPAQDVHLLQAIAAPIPSLLRWPGRSGVHLYLMHIIAIA